MCLFILMFMGQCRRYFEGTGLEFDFAAFWEPKKMA